MGIFSTNKHHWGGTTLQNHLQWWTCNLSVSWVWYRLERSSIRRTGDSPCVVGFKNQPAGLRWIWSLINSERNTSAIQCRSAWLFFPSLLNRESWNCHNMMGCVGCVTAISKPSKFIPSCLMAMYSNNFLTYIRLPMNHMINPIQYHQKSTL